MKCKLRPGLLFPIIALLVILTAAVGCKRVEIPELELPETSILSVRQNWAIVKFSYLSLYSGPGITNKIVWQAREGDVFEVAEQSLETETLYSIDDYWFRVQRENIDGWVFGGGLQFYSSREEALDAASRLHSGEDF